MLLRDGLSSLLRDPTENDAEWWNGEYIERYKTLAAADAILLLTSDEFFVAFDRSLVLRMKTPIVVTHFDDRDGLTTHVSCFSR